MISTNVEQNHNWPHYENSIILSSLMVLQKSIPVNCSKTELLVKNCYYILSTINSEEYHAPQINITSIIYNKLLQTQKSKYKNATVKYSGSAYALPATVFTEQNNWASGDFIYLTGSSSTKQITATGSAGYSIFWKVSK